MADQNLKQIQFKRTSTENKAPGADIVARGEIVLNTHGRTLAIYTKDEADKVVQLTGKGVPFLDTAGNLNVDGTTTLKDNVTISPNKAINFEASDLSGALVRHITGKAGSNDGWYIGAGGASDQGFLEIGTYDNGNEPIYFVQRTGGAAQAEVRRLTLLDGLGDTLIPGDLRLTSKAVKISNGSTLTLEMGVGTNDAYIKNLRGTGVLQLTNDSNLTFRNSQVYYAMDGRGPGKSGTLLTNVENNRQAWQYTISAATAATVRWVKVATMKHPGDASSQLDLMITGGIDSGHGKHYVDFITLSGRNLQSLNTSNLDNWVEWRRVGAPSKGNVPEYYVVKADDTAFDFYAKLPRYGNALSVTVLNTAGYNGQDSGKVIIYETNQDTGATGPTGNILVSMKQIFDSYSKPDFGDTTGTLPVNRGGTGATTAGDARNNLGLRTAAVRDVGESSGNVMEVGAFGVGGKGKSIVDITSDVDLMTRLKAIGGTVFRANVKVTDGKPVWEGSPFYSHGSGLYVTAGDTMAALNIDYSSGNIRVFAVNDTVLAQGKVNYNMLYGTANKPQAADNDFVSKASGGTFDGDIKAPALYASSNGVGSIYVEAGTASNAHLWFYSGRGSSRSERGVIWAEPSTASLGAVNIRAKNTAGVSSGNFQFRSDGIFRSPSSVHAGNAKFGTDGNITDGALFGGNLNNYLSSISQNANNRVLKSGDTMTGNLTINANLSARQASFSGNVAINSSGGSWFDVGSEDETGYSRITLARKIGTSAKVANMKMTPQGEIQFGIQNTVSQASPDKYILISSNDIKIEGATVFNTSYQGTEDAINISDKTIDLNSLVIKKTDAGTRRLYQCLSSGGGSNISNKPTSDGNFVLEVLSLRKVSDSDYSCKQTYTTKNGGIQGTYVRYCQNGTWGAWNTVSDGIQPVSLGGTGSNNVSGARNNLGLGESQTVTFGSLITGDLTTNGNQRLVGRLNLGSTTATSGVLRSNAAGAVVLGSASGQSIHIRAGSEDVSTGETRFDSNGNVTVNGLLTATNLNASQYIKTTADNSYILMGKDSDLGFVKKNGASSRLAFASGKSFVVSKSSATAISNPGSETYTDVFKVDADGNQTVYGNSTISRALTVSSTTTIAGVINANGGIIVPTTKYVQIADAPTQNNQATNKKYVDDKVASAISNAGDTYLPLKGGTLTGTLVVNNVGPIEKKGIRTYTDGSVTVNETDGIKLVGNGNIFGMLRLTERVNNTTFIGLQTSIGTQNGWFEFHHTGRFVANTMQATGEVSGAGGLLSTNGNITCKAPSPGLNTNYWFRDSAGNERGVIWSNGSNGDMVIRNQGGRELVFQNDGWLKLGHLAPGNTDTTNQVNGLRLQRGDTILDNFNEWKANEFVRGGWHFYNAGGVDQWLTIRDNGVWIDGSAPDLRVGRNGSFDNVEIRSDRRSKDNIVKIENALDKVCTLTGNTYTLNHKNGTSSISAGLIAQEVQEVLPEAVTVDNDEDALLRLNYNAVIALLVESVKELKAEIEELKSK